MEATASLATASLDFFVQAVIASEAVAPIMDARVPTAWHALEAPAGAPVAEASAMECSVYQPMAADISHLSQKVLARCEDAAQRDTRG